jgi:hypothetical protein
VELWGEKQNLCSITEAKVRFEFGGEVWRELKEFGERLMRGCKLDTHGSKSTPTKQEAEEGNKKLER